MDSEEQRGGKEDRLAEAARVAIAREERMESPEGDWQHRLWHPAPSERRPCCEGIEPTSTNRQALEHHCRTQGHIAQLFDVSPIDLRRAVKRARQADETLPASQPAVQSASSRGGRAQALYEVSRGAQGASLNELHEEAEHFGTVLPRLQAASGDEGLVDMLTEALESIDRLKLVVEYCLKIENTYRMAQEVREMVTQLQEQRRQSV